MYSLVVIKYSNHSLKIYINKEYKICVLRIVWAFYVILSKHCLYITYSLFWLYIHSASKNFWEIANMSRLLKTFCCKRVVFSSFVLMVCCFPYSMIPHNIQSAIYIVYSRLEEQIKWTKEGYIPDQIKEIVLCLSITTGRKVRQRVDTITFSHSHSPLQRYITMF